MKLTDLVNLTASDVVIRTPRGDVTLPPSGRLVRVVRADEHVRNIDGVQVVHPVMTVTGFPQEPVPVLVNYQVFQVMRCLDVEPAQARLIFTADYGPSAVWDRRHSRRVEAATQLLTLYDHTVV